MELTPAEERKIIDGVRTFIDAFARSVAEHSARVAAEDFQGTPPKRKVERELAKAIFTPQNSDFDEGRGVANYEERKTCSCRCAPEESRATKDFVKSRVLPPTGVPHLIPVPKWNDYHEYPRLGGLRHLIFNAEKTGFDKVIKRVGRRILIDEAAFFEWVSLTPGKNGD